MYLWLILPYPHDLGGCEARQYGVAGPLHDPVKANFLGNGSALGAGTLVIPHNTGTQHLPSVIQQHQAMHLSCEPQSLHLRPTDVGQYLSYALHSGLPPVGWVLLRP